MRALSIPPTSPPPIPVLDTEAIRRKLAGLTDPSRKPGGTERTEIRDIASRCCSILAHLFGEDLDRLTLWSRIDSALETAGAKVSDDDLDRWLSLCLEHVKADAGRAAACDSLQQVIETFAVRPAEWRHELLAYIATHRYAVVARGRARWEQVKRKEVDL